jgi:hypothetical protein
MTGAARHDVYVTIWKDPDSPGGLLTYFDHRKIAVRSRDDVSRSIDPKPRLLQDTRRDREFLDAWLAAPESTSDTTLAVPTALVVDILGWEV